MASGDGILVIHSIPDGEREPDLAAALEDGTFASEGSVEPIRTGNYVGAMRVYGMLGCAYGHCEKFITDTPPIDLHR